VKRTRVFVAKDSCKSTFVFGQRPRERRPYDDKSFVLFSPSGATLGRQLPPDLIETGEVWEAELTLKRKLK
jgi:hypothetical protein